MKEEKKEDRELLLRCDCGCNVLLLHEYIEEMDTQLEYEFVFYGYGIDNSTNFWNRVKYAFRYIFTGKGFTSSFVLSKNDINKFKDFIK